MSRAILLDTNLLVLLVVGITSEKLISEHKRTRAYDLSSFRLLRRLLAATSAQLMTSPHVLAEASNLLRQYKGRERLRMNDILGEIIEGADERHVPAKLLVRDKHFPWLGLTDAGLISLAAGDTIVLTDDLDVYLAAQRSGFEAVNFTYLRDAEE
jgi:predicted nucleic acid-binding protein